MMILRDYQQSLKQDIYASWHAGNRNVLGVSATGSGKTVVFSSIFNDMQTRDSCAIAHRQELVSQISIALAQLGIYHNIHASNQVVKFCVAQHMEMFGQSYYDNRSPVAVSGVRTLIQRAEKLKQWMSAVQMWTLDEAHHAALDNQWWKAIAQFKNAWGLGVTATPIRTDRQPLGAKFGGMFHDMVRGPSMRHLINKGYLSDYRIFAPTVSIDISNIPVSQKTGELNQTAMRKEAHKSTITGDVVDHYMRIAGGKRGITFAVDVEQAQEIADNYNAKGVSAAAVSAKTPDHIRADVIKRFRAGGYLQLVNVDLFGEGFDVPACEVVSMGRPTESFGLYSQQFGRALRPFEGKTHGIILDHVGNVKRHGLPDSREDWTLDIDYRGRKVQTEFVTPVRTCIRCFQVFEALSKTCPYCGAVDEPESRGAPEFIDGDLVEFSPELLDQLRGRIGQIEMDEPLIPFGAHAGVKAARHKYHAQHQAALGELRDVLNMWGGIQQQLHDRTKSQSYRLFYHRFGLDVMTAQTLKLSDMQKLSETIRETFDD